MFKTKINDTLNALHHIRKGLNLNEEETNAVSNEFTALEEMIDKLENGVVEIAVFGEVGSGKSSLLNALLGTNVFETGARNGVTVIKDKQSWNVDQEVFSGQGNSKLVVVDTPGINEVDGEERANIAKHTIRDTDLILFVTDGDLNDIEQQAIKSLHELNKPIILVLNKSDIHNKKQRSEIYHSISEKIEGIIKPENIILAAGDPLERKVVIQKADLTEVTELRKPKPVIGDLKNRIFEILADEGNLIVALNASLFASDITDRIMQEKIKFRRQFAEKIVRKFMIIKAAAVAINPVPLVDMVGGVTADYYMLKAIGEVYDVELTLRGSQTILTEASKGMGLLGLTEMATHIVAGALELSTFGLANIVTGVPQGVVSGWTSYIVGNASHEYFANGCSWGDKGAKGVLKEIIDSTDKDSIVAEIKSGIHDAINAKKNKKS